MKTWFKYAGVFLFVCLVVAFFSREHFAAGLSSSIPPEKPERLLPPYGNVLYTEGGELSDSD